MTSEILDNIIENIKNNINERKKLKDKKILLLSIDNFVSVFDEDENRYISKEDFIKKIELKIEKLRKEQNRLSVQKYYYTNVNRRL